MQCAMAVVAAAVVGCNRSPSSPETGAGEKRPVIGVSLLNLSSEFIAMIDKAMEKRAAELGVCLIVNDAQRRAEKQVQQVEGFVAQHVDAIILNPCEVEASSPAVEKAWRPASPS